VAFVIENSHRSIPCGLLGLDVLIETPAVGLGLETACLLLE
jgi:hypothetical protein